MAAKATDFVHLEKGAVASLWNRLDTLLLGGSDAAQLAIGLVQDSLPKVHQLDPLQLPDLILLHLSSASNMCKTLRLLAPGMFVDGSVSFDNSRLMQLETGLLSMVITLTDLQLFHLQRAAALVALSRMRLSRGAAPQDL